MSKTKVINLFGGPGTGKSTTAAHLFALMKHQGLEVELAREFAKDLVWEENFKPFSNQLHITSTQYHRIWTLKDQVDFIICDCPILMGKVYGPEYHSLMEELNNKFSNVNIFLKRVKPYKQAGRMQTESEAIHLDTQIKKILDEDFYEIDADFNAASKILEILNE